MKKYFILLCLGAFIVAFYNNHFDNLIVNIIIIGLGYGLIFSGYGKILTKPLLKRIKALNFGYYINNYFLKAIEEGFEDTSFTLNEDELKEYKEIIDLYRKQHGSIVYKIEYELDSKNDLHKCKFVKAYDMNKKEWIDEQGKTMHLIRNRDLIRLYMTSFFNNEEIEVEFNNKKYSCIVTSIKYGDINEKGDLLMGLDLVIVKEID